MTAVTSGAVAPATLPRKANAAPSVLLERARGLGLGAAFFFASLAILLGIWWVMCLTFAQNLPTPIETTRSLAAMLARPYFVASDGTMGIINLIFASLVRVFTGFFIGAAVAIPLGILMGTSTLAKRLIDPISQVMRPVSPLAWFPLAQVVFLSIPNADLRMPFTIIGTIALTCLWPTLVNTAFGVASLPEDFRTVARVFQFSPTRYVTKILLPYALPHIVTGLRLSMGIAWLVIVAAEMLSGQPGVGFSAFDAYNQGNFADMTATIIVIGFVGLVLDRGFDFLQKKFTYEEQK